jgi:hypothetical protein
MHPPQRWCDRDDRGDASIEALVVMLALILILTFVAAASLTRGPVLARAGHGLIWTGGIAAVMALTAAAIRLGDWQMTRSNTRIRRQLGPLLSGWLGRAEHAQLTNEDLRQWRRARRVGVTIGEAQHWSDHGLPYPVAAAARRRHVPLPTAVALAEAMRDAQLWDGVDRDALTRLLAQHTRHPADNVPPVVIHRWAQFTPDQIRRTCRVVLGDPVAQRPELVPSYRTSVNAIKVLCALEAAE